MRKIYSLLFVIMALLIAPVMLAQSVPNTFYMQLSAQASPQQAGYVYVCMGDNDLLGHSATPGNAALVLASDSSYRAETLDGSIGSLMTDGTYTAYLFARARDGYAFQSWRALADPAGTLSVATKVDDYVLQRNYFKQEIKLDTLSMTRGFDMDTYLQQILQAHPEWLDNTGNILPAYEPLATALFFRTAPFTTFGPWLAQFEASQVVAAFDTIFTVTHPLQEVPMQARFQVANSEKTTDFSSLLQGEGLTYFTPGQYTSVKAPTANQYLFQMRYRPRNIHGIHRGKAVLIADKATGQATSQAEAIITITEDYTPAFSLSVSHYNFGSADLGQSDTILVYLQDRNAVASLSAAQGLIWSARFSTTTSMTATMGEDGICTIVYPRLNGGTENAQLTITATYTDAVGQTLMASQTCALSGATTSTLSPNTLRWNINHLWVDDHQLQPFVGQNNTNPISITCDTDDWQQLLTIDDNGTPSPKLSAAGSFRTGHVHLVATQPASAQVDSAHIETTIFLDKHTPIAVWNWQKLYWGNTADNPVSTTSDAYWTLTKIADAQEVISYDTLLHQAQVAQSSGQAHAYFRFLQSASNTFWGLDTIFHTDITSDPGMLPLSVADSATFADLTIEQGSAVSFLQGAVRFAYRPADDYLVDRAWTFAFHGYPDRLIFNASGENTWCIQESTDGRIWRTTFADERITVGHFECRLQMSSRFVRIIYGAQPTDGDGRLSNVQVTQHPRVRAYDNKVWLPMQNGQNVALQSLLVDLLSDQPISLSVSSPDFDVTPQLLPADSGQFTLQVASTAAVGSQANLLFSTSTPDATAQSADDAQCLLQVPLQVYAFPQSLPIRWETDEADRFFCTMTESQCADWQADTRMLLFHNSEPNTLRSATFAFADIPYRIRFYHDGTNASDRWHIEESSDAQNWTDALAPAAETTGQMSAFLQPSTRFVRVSYRSGFTQSVHLSQLSIVGQQRVEKRVDSLCFSTDTLIRTLHLTAVDVPGITLQISAGNGNNNTHFTISDGVHSAAQVLTLTADDYVDILGHNHFGTLPLTIVWDGQNAFEQATLIVRSTTDSQLLTTIPLLAQWTAITASNVASAGFCTGVVDGLSLTGSFSGSNYRPIDLSVAFDDSGHTLFDQLFIFGPTSTTNDSSVITAPTATQGSNALTPCFVLKKVSETNYQFLRVMDNANAAARLHTTSLGNLASRKVLITGFCPYTSIGYTKGEEGAFHFQANPGEAVDVYLSDAFLYARNKSYDGSKNVTTTFSENYVRGSGAVLVFECTGSGNVDNPMQAAIHFRNSNCLTSNIGCYYSFTGGKVTQVSTPVQVRTSGRNSYTELTFDDLWPSSARHTRGLLSLHKPALNAPTIDMGNANTVVNFRGGQVEMENAQSLSTNYHSSQAIAWRSGKMSGIMLAAGLGDDGLGGTVRFYDGTTTALPMTVQPQRRSYYQMDQGDSTITYCLRLPENTMVFGGSHDPIRVCAELTSRGGAPTDGISLLGRYAYPMSEGQSVDLSTIFSDDDSHSSLADYYASHGLPPYATNSVVPDVDGFVYLWIPEGYGHVAAERDQRLEYWKACMTSIEAEQNGYGGSIGGDVAFPDNTTVENFLYCVLDDNMHDVIANPNYSAPLLNPATGEYMTIHPTHIGERNQYYVTNVQPYSVQSKLYYITTVPSADQWMTFTAPFDVSRIWVMETFNEQALQQMYTEQSYDRESIAFQQAEHNADFAAFYGVTMVLGQNKSFDAIYDDYIRWAKLQDQELGYYDGVGDYDIRGRKLLTPYAQSADTAADFLLYEANTNWTSTLDDSLLLTGWHLVAPVTDNNISGLDNDNLRVSAPLMLQHHSYAMLFPYCPGCDIIDTTETGWVDYLPREYWDYWTGKLLIMEGDGPQTLQGSSYLSDIMAVQPPRKSAVHTGNSTFALLDSNPADQALHAYIYDPIIYNEGFWYNGELDAEMGNVVQPAQSFLLGNLPYTNGVDLISGRITHSADYVPDTIPVIPPDTIVTPPDTIPVIPPDTIVTPPDTIPVIPHDTIVTPPDTIPVIPPDTIVTPPDTIPVDTAGSALEYVLQSGRFRIYTISGQPLFPGTVTQTELYLLPPGIYIASDDRQRSFLFAVRK